MQSVAFDQRLSVSNSSGTRVQLCDGFRIQLILEVWPQASTTLAHGPESPTHAQTHGQRTTASRRFICHPGALFTREKSPTVLPGTLRFTVPSTGCLSLLPSPTCTVNSNTIAIRHATAGSGSATAGRHSEVSKQRDTVTGTAPRRKTTSPATEPYSYRLDVPR